MKLSRSGGIVSMQLCCLLKSSMRIHHIFGHLLLNVFHRKSQNVQVGEDFRDLLVQYSAQERTASNNRQPNKCSSTLSLNTSQGGPLCIYSRCSSFQKAPLHPELESTSLYFCLSVLILHIEYCHSFSQCGNCSLRFH